MRKFRSTRASGGVVVALLVLGILVHARVAQAGTTVATRDAAPLVEQKPGESEFVRCSRYPDGKRFRWGVRGEVGVGELVASLSTISCQSVVVSGAIAGRSGKVTIDVPDLLTAAEVYRLFYASLEVMGLTVESHGKILKVIDVARGKDVSQPLAADADTPTTDQWVTRLLRLQHAKPQDIADVLGKVRSKEGDVTVYAPSQSLLITDRASHVRRMETLVQVLDVPKMLSADRMFVLATHGSFPTELAAALEKILLAGKRPEGDGKTPATAAGMPLADGITALVPVDSARLVVMVGTDPGFARLHALALRLDPPQLDGASAGSQARVIYLAHTNAEETVAALQSIGLTTRGPGAGPSGPAKPGATSNATPLGELRIGADKVSNAILVYGGNAEFQMVRELVKQIDLPRRQVYVEATILDISVDKARNLGLTFHSGAGNSEVGGVVASNQGSLNTLAIDAASLASAASGGGLLAGLIGKSVQAAGFTLPSFGVILKALEHSKDVSVISKPHLLTTDNVKSTLSVGQKIPYAAQSLGTAATGSAASLITSYQRFDVALKIELTPHLNDSDSVRLEIDTEISDVPDGQSSAAAGGPTTNNRTLKTAVVVRDGEPVVLGGLQKETQSETIDKIPGLGDIPILGRLFQTRGKQRTKQDLLIVLTPYIIRGPEDLRRIAERKETERREFVERFSAFADEKKWEPHVDYRRKRGLLEEINRTAEEVEREVLAIRSAKQTLGKIVVEGPIE